MSRSCTIVSTLLTLLLFTGVGFGQLFVENFDYLVGDSLTNNGWRPEGGQLNPITVNDGGLAYPEYPGSNIGNAALLDGPDGQDVQRDFTPVRSGTLYFTAMVNVASATLNADAFIFSAKYLFNIKHLAHLNATNTQP